MEFFGFAQTPTHSLRAASVTSAQMERFNIVKRPWIHGNVTMSSHCVAEVEMLVWSPELPLETTSPSTPIQPPGPDVVAWRIRTTADNPATTPVTEHRCGLSHNDLTPKRQREEEGSDLATEGDGGKCEFGLPLCAIRTNDTSLFR